MIEPLENEPNYDDLLDVLEALQDLADPDVYYSTPKSSHSTLKIP